ncbi:unnamed protein product [Orchesella dallaii]|uniref:F-box domain-containing protein n=1 Tax=Orchesella dallaii TaxID=48710 RepID=A0ABP1RE04_9HEXA
MASDGELSVSKKYIMDEESEEKDERCPFNLLPEKVVEIIFNKLGNVDLQKCLNTCDTWKNILKPKRIYFQFELVLPVLLKRLSLEDCLSCRLVCRKWKKGVDTVLDNHPSRVNVPDEHTRENAFPLRFINAVDDPNISTGRLFGDFGMVISRFWTFFTYRDKIDRNFMEEMNSHCGNPFVGRNLKMRVTLPQEYVISARTVLERFGTHIWYARLRFDDSMRTQAEMEEFPVEIRIRDALSLLPNLKSLCLDVCIHERTEALSSLEIRARNYFQRHPLPTLRNLETFSCGLFFRTPSILIDSVLELCCVKETLKILDLSESKAKYKSTFKFPNLEDLVIKVDMEELPGLVEDYPHLKKLRLILSKRNGGENESPQRIHCEEVFVVLESLQDNLIELGIQAEQSNWSLADSFILCSCRDDFRINFPNLESLGLHCHVRPENLQNLGSLKHLELRVFIEEADADSFNLNMGLLIPSLKSLHYYGSRANIKLKRDVASGMLLVQNEGRYVDLESLGKEGSEDQGAKEWEEEGEEEGKEVRFHIWSRMFKRHLIYSLFMFSLIFGLGVGCGTQFLRH